MRKSDNKSTKIEVGYENEIEVEIEIEIEVACPSAALAKSGI
ncbi:MAG: hypothetical protein ACOH2D_01275 [Gelidibacter sp.]